MLAHETANPLVARLQEYVKHPESDNYTKQLLALLSQRRDLQETITKELLDGDTDVIPPSLLVEPPTVSTVDKERRALQRRLVSLPRKGEPATLAGDLKRTLERCMDPLRGTKDVPHLALHFHQRLACLHVERVSLLRQMVKRQRAYFTRKRSELTGLMKATGALDAEVEDWAATDFAHQEQMARAREALARMQAAEVDAATRLARIEEQAVADEGDWQAAAAYAAFRLPLGRVGQRLIDRLDWLVYSHHHRFALYEKVMDAEKVRCATVSTAGLDKPPTVLEHGQQVADAVEELLEVFDLGSDSVLPEDELHRAHQTAYLSRTALPKFMAMQNARWPTVFQEVQGLVEEKKTKLAEAAAVRSYGQDDDEAPNDNGDPEAGLVSGERVHVINDMGDRMPHLVPHPQSDLDGPHVALVRDLVHHIDESLHAENDYLDTADAEVVLARMRMLADRHIERWGPNAEVAAARDATALAERELSGLERSAVEVTLSLAAHNVGDVHLRPKPMETFFVLRFLKTRRHKLAVLHYLNALASLQADLLKDEDEEMVYIDMDERPPSRYTHPHSQPGSSTGRILEHVRKQSKRNAAALQPEDSQDLGGFGNEASGAAGTSKSDEDGVVGSDRGYWEQDDEVGVAVRDAQGRWVVYQWALDQFERLEREILSVATYYLEKQAAKMEAGFPDHWTDERRAVALESIDKLAILADLWELECNFAAARHGAVEAYRAAYSHATDEGLQDLFSQLPEGHAPPASAEAKAAVGVSMQPPVILAPRQRLRRHLVDLCFRRPGLAPEDGYMAGRYIHETLSLQLEESLATGVCKLAAADEQAILSQTYASLANARVDAAAGSSDVAPDNDESASRLADLQWLPGLPAVLAFRPTDAGSRSFTEEIYLMPSIGAAAAALAASLSRLVTDFCELHQIQSCVHTREARLALLRAARVELAMLSREESVRPHAHPPPPPKDSRRGKRAPTDGGGPPAPPPNPLATSIVGDNAIVIMGLARSGNAVGRDIIAALMLRERLLRTLYATEVVGLVADAQYRALGIQRVSEVKGIEWDAVDVQGNPLRPESLEEFEKRVPPCEATPPGLAGPPDSDAPSPPEPHRGRMLCVGTAGCLGGVWRAPPLALAEFTTTPTEVLDFHNVADLRKLLTEGPEGLPARTLKTAVKAQELRLMCLGTAVRHNQVVLDQIVRKTDRRRRTALYRTAAVQGMVTEPTLEAHTVGAPPRMGLSVVNADDGDALPNNAPVDLDSKAIADLEAFRASLVKQAEPIILRLGPAVMEQRQAACVQFVRTLHDMATSRRSGVSINEAGMDGVRLTIFDTYAEAIFGVIYNAALRVDITRVANRLARGLLGGSGGFGHSWGLKIAPDARRLEKDPERGPFFKEALSKDRGGLQEAVLEYAPLWQQLDWEIIDSDSNPDAQAWHPPADPGLGFCLPRADGAVSLDQLWELPKLWDVLGMRYPRQEEALLAQGAALGHEMALLVEAKMSLASLLTPSSHLAKGGDVDLAATVMGGDADFAADADDDDDVHQGMKIGMKDVSTGSRLFDQLKAKQEQQMADLSARGDMFKVIKRAKLASLEATLPGALMEPDLIALHAQLCQLAKGSGASIQTRLPKSTRDARMKPQGLKLAASRVVSFIRQRAAVAVQLQITSVRRARDSMQASGRAENAWHLAGGLEHLVASTAAQGRPTHRAWAMALRLRDNERTIIHNTMLKMMLVMERGVVALKVPAATNPERAAQIEAFVLSAMYVHDSLRDALLVRALQWEHPALAGRVNPAQTISVSPYIRSYGNYYLDNGVYHPPDIMAWMQSVYDKHIAGAAQQLVTRSLPPPQPPKEKVPDYLKPKEEWGQEEEVNPDAIEGASEDPETVFWGQGSPAAASLEVRGIESAILVLRRLLDKQGLDISFTTLKLECASLAGISLPAGVVVPGPLSGAARLATLEMGMGDGWWGHKIIAKLMRRLGQLRVRSLDADEDDDDANWVVEPTSMTRWVEEMVRSVFVAAESHGAVLLDTSQQLQRSLAQLEDEMIEAVEGFRTQVLEQRRQQQIKIDTQVCDSGMELLIELSKARRTALRALSDAENAMETAMMDAQTDWADRVEALEREVMLTKSNAKSMQADFQRGALETLSEVRREALQKIFGENYEGSDEMAKVMRLEGDLEAARAEIMDLERTNTKVQTWFKLRAIAFQSVCEREVLAMQKQVNELQKDKYEAREQVELYSTVLEQQLSATQEDLEVVSADLKKAGHDLEHALRSNKNLMQYKMRMGPRMMSLKSQLHSMKAKKAQVDEIIKNQEKKSAQVVPKSRTSILEEMGGGGSDGPARESSERISPPGGRFMRHPLKAQLAALKQKVEDERRAKNEALDALALMQQEAAAGGAGGPPGQLKTVTADVYRRRYEDLLQSHQALQGEARGLRAVIKSVNVLVPEIVRSAQLASEVDVAALGPVESEVVGRVPSTLPPASPIGAPLPHEGPRIPTTPSEASAVSVAAQASLAASVAGPETPWEAPATPRRTYTSSPPRAPRSRSQSRPMSAVRSREVRMDASGSRPPSARSYDGAGPGFRRPRSGLSKGRSNLSPPGSRPWSGASAGAADRLLRVTPSTHSLATGPRSRPASASTTAAPADVPSLGWVNAALAATPQRGGTGTLSASRDGVKPASLAPLQTTAGSLQGTPKKAAARPPARPASARAAAAGHPGPGTSIEAAGALPSRLHAHDGAVLRVGHSAQTTRRSP